MNEQAFPTQSDLHGVQEKGLTKREYFAAMALQGLCANKYVTILTCKDHAEYSVECADALMQELNKKEVPNE